MLINTTNTQCRSQWGPVHRGEDLRWQVWAEFPALSHTGPCDLLQTAPCVCSACLASLTLHILLVQSVCYRALYIPYHCVPLPSLCRATGVCLWLRGYCYPGYWQACPEKWMFRFSVFFTSSAIVWCFVFHVLNLTYIPFLLLHPAFAYLGLHPCPSLSPLLQPVKTPCSLDYLI